MRADVKCPESCPYAAKYTEGVPLPALKADSRTEMEHGYRLLLDLWVIQQNELLDGSTPVEYAAKDKDLALKWLSGFQYPPQFPINYLMQKLSLPYSEQTSAPDPEEVVQGFFNTALKLDFNNLRSYTINSSRRPDLAQRYQELVSENKALSRISTFSIIHSGSGDDGRSALVFLELNHKSDWTVILSNSTGEWKIRQNIVGNPQAYFQQNAVHSSIAEALGKGEDAKAWELISQSLKIYPDNADLYYYRALYWQLVKQADQAAVDMFNAVSLDNNWPEPFIHLGNLSLASPNYIQAQEWYLEALELQPDNPQVMNNLAATYANTGNYTEARAVWERLLSLYPTFELARQNLNKLP